MILGVEHIALSCDNLEAGVDAVKTLGYKDKFVQKDLPNNLAKTELLKTYEPFHSIAYCQHPNSVSIELTQHSSPLIKSSSFYQVQFSGTPQPCTNGIKTTFPSSIWRSALDLQASKYGLWSPFKSEVWYADNSNERKSNAIIGIALQVSDLANSQRFWTEAFGCHVIRRSSPGEPAWTLLSIVSPVPSWSLKIVLIESKLTGEKPFLDDSGFPCLALISNNLKKDTAKILQCGGQSATGEFVSTVNGKMLQIQLLRGPDQELIELIKFQQ